MVKTKKKERNKIFIEEIVWCKLAIKGVNFKWLISHTDNCLDFICLWFLNA